MCATQNFSNRQVSIECIQWLQRRLSEFVPVILWGVLMCTTHSIETCLFEKCVYMTFNRDLFMCLITPCIQLYTVTAEKGSEFGLATWWGLLMCVNFQHQSMYLCEFSSSVNPPKNGLIALQTPRTSRLSTFNYCHLVIRALLRLLSTYILV